MECWFTQLLTLQVRTILVDYCLDKPSVHWVVNPNLLWFVKNHIAIEILYIICAYLLLYEWMNVYCCYIILSNLLKILVKI